MSFKLWQIYYREDQKPKIYHFATPYYNEGLTIYFESAVIAKLIPTCQTDKVGVCSWKLHDKSRRIHPVTPERLDSDYQVLSFTRNSERHNMLAMAANWHVDFMPAIKMLWDKLGLKLPGEVKHAIYQNHFTAKTEIYKQYVSEFLQPAIDLIEKDEELNTIMKKPSGYGRLSKDADLKAVQAKLGMNDYPLCCFVLERCPSAWFTINRTPITFL
jgi:hypothetical protein